MCVWYGRARTALFPVRFAASASFAIYADVGAYQAVSSRRSSCLRFVARLRARTVLPHRRAMRCLSIGHRVSSLIQRSAVAQLVECRTRNRESPGSNPRCYRFEVWAFSFISRRLSRLSCINEYLAIDSGGDVSE